MSLSKLQSNKMPPKMSFSMKLIKLENVGIFE